MNIDIIQGNDSFPKWWWMVVISLLTTFLSFSGLLIYKYSNVKKIDLLFIVESANVSSSKILSVVKLG
jgi:hypothetical protein